MSTFGAMRFPTFYQEKLSEVKTDDHSSRLRICVDFIAGMTERQAYNYYQRLIGTAPGSGLNAALI
jgi:dGTP triphosphohydrolase